MVIAAVSRVIWDRQAQTRDRQGARYIGVSDGRATVEGGGRCLAGHTHRTHTRLNLYQALFCAKGETTTLYCKIFMPHLDLKLVLERHNRVDSLIVAI